MDRGCGYLEIVEKHGRPVKNPVGTTISKRLKPMMIVFIPQETMMHRRHRKLRHSTWSLIHSSGYVHLLGFQIWFKKNKQMVRTLTKV